MKKTILIVIGIIVTLFLLGFLFGGWGYRGESGFGSRGMMGTSMMGGWGFSPFGWIGMIFMWVIPLGFLVLIVFGIAWLVQNVGSGNKIAVPTISTAVDVCPSCKHEVQSDWRNCAYCGTSLN